jgi:UDP-GlcNAc:undecaprenyl-phosphate/decaprenyl-phosphate GlcNAc-1-phosphate transferase
LLFNYTPAKIFMGDTGSMLVGLINAILLLHFIKVADAPGSVLPIASAPVIGLTILAVPLFDTLRIFTIRILVHRRSPFSPDRGHIHHLLLDCGFSHPGTTFTLSVYNLVLIVLAFAFRGAGNEFLLVGLVITGLSFSGMASYLKQPRRTPVFIRNITIARAPATESALAESGAVQRKPSYQQKGVVAPMTMPSVFSLEEE